MRIISENLYLKIGLSYIINHSFEEKFTRRLIFIDTTYSAALRATDFDGLIIYVTPRPFNRGWRDFFSTEVRYGENVFVGMPVKHIIARVGTLSRSRKHFLQDTGHMFKLTDKEVNVIRILACGVTPDECSLIMDMSIKTISNYKRSAMVKLGIGSQLELYRTLSLLRKYKEALLTVE